MLNLLKRFGYFPLAWYFRFWAGIKLKRWHPRVIVITGSSGKTTLLHLIESQLGDKAKYSHHANSSYGIPFDILGLHRHTLTIWEWPKLFLLAPLKAFSPPPSINLYVVEADCDRPGEGKFLSEFLQPEVTLWLNVSKTHSQNFPSPVLENITREFGFFAQNTSRLLVTTTPYQSRAQIILIDKKEWLNKYKVTKIGTQFTLKEKNYSFKCLLPEETAYSIAICIELMNYLSHPLDGRFSNFHPPPGRSSIFAGIKNTTLIDSTHNATPAAMKVIIDMVDRIPEKNKWAIISDMTELGQEEAMEHKKLGEILSKTDFDKIILMGPRTQKYTYPELSKSTQSFLTPVEVLKYLQTNITGGETILFKGARFLEGVIAQLLADKADIAKLPRREKIWELRRQQWGL